MNKEELRKEAEEWLDERYLKDMGVRKPCRQAYLAGAEPREKRIASLEAQIKKLINFALSKIECCDVCPINDTCINSEGTCIYAGIRAKGEEEVTREWLIQFISRGKEKMNKDEADLIITEQNKVEKKYLKVLMKVKSDCSELCNLKDMRIAELEKENAGLKSGRDSVETALERARDLISNLIRVTYGEGWNYSLDWKVTAEQFLKEVGGVK